MERNQKIEIGDEVRTKKGAAFRGIVIAIDTDAISPGCTVRADHPWFTGTKHVYPLVQLEIVRKGDDHGA